MPRVLILIETLKDRHFHHFAGEESVGSEDQKGNLSMVGTLLLYSEPLIGNQTCATPKSMFLPNTVLPDWEYTESSPPKGRW